MPENDEMSQETEIAVISENMKNLAKSFDELKETLEKRDTEIHNHINRKIGDDIIISSVTLKSDIKSYADSEIKLSEKRTDLRIKTLAGLVVVVWLLAFGAFVFLDGRFAPAKTSTASEMAELFKIMMQENRKNVKQTQVIIEPERVIP